jgi:hypothetical protein
MYIYSAVFIHYFVEPFPLTFSVFPPHDLFINVLWRRYSTYRSGMNSGPREETFKTRVILTGVAHATGNNIKKYSQFEEVCDHSSVTPVIATNSFKFAECGFANTCIYRQRSFRRASI